jgi:hypothetical protein
MAASRRKHAETQTDRLVVRIKQLHRQNDSFHHQLNLLQRKLQNYQAVPMPTKETESAAPPRSNGAAPQRTNKEDKGLLAAASSHFPAVHPNSIFGSQTEMRSLPAANPARSNGDRK